MTNTSPDIKVFLIGNKADLNDKRLITTKIASEFKDNYDFDLFMETSAKSGLNSEQLFVEAGLLLYKEYSELKKNPGKKLKLNANKGKEKKCC